MRWTIRAALVITILAAAGTPFVALAQEGRLRVAVLDFRNPARVSDQEADYITDLVRTEARRALPTDRFILMTKENIYELLPPDKKDLAACEGQCEVETGRMIGADYLVTGEVVRFGGEFRVTARLYETAHGNLLDGQKVRGKAVLDLEAPLEEVAITLFAAISGAQPRQAATRPLPLDSAPPPAPRAPSLPPDRASPPPGFVLIRPGTFTMGSPYSEAGRIEGEDQHEVVLTRYFYLAEAEVTQGLWKKVMGSNPSRFPGCGDDCPVEQVSWYDAIEFCNRLSDREGLGRCYSGSRTNVIWNEECTGYRLPTEAEFEYAARAGSISAIYSGSLTVVSSHSGPELDSIAWYGGNSGVDYSGAAGCSSWAKKQYQSKFCGTHPVRRKAANSWGLYDTLGNVWEWAWDWNDPYPKDRVTDPVGPPSGISRVIRGGSWSGYAWGCRSACRSSFDPSTQRPECGFRLARSVR